MINIDDRCFLALEKITWRSEKYITLIYCFVFQKYLGVPTIKIFLINILFCYK